jgi:hypothetical protein
MKVRNIRLPYMLEYFHLIFDILRKMYSRHYLTVRFRKQYGASFGKTCTHSPINAVFGDAVHSDQRRAVAAMAWRTLRLMAHESLCTTIEY